MFDDDYSLWFYGAFVAYRKIGWVGRLGDRLNKKRAAKDGSQVVYLPVIARNESDEAIFLQTM